jgi:gamma-glutamyltranspeptidase
MLMHPRGGGGGGGGHFLIWKGKNKNKIQAK